MDRKMVSNSVVLPLVTYTLQKLECLTIPLLSPPEYEPSTWLAALYLLTGHSGDKYIIYSDSLSVLQSLKGKKLEKPSHSTAVVKASIIFKKHRFLLAT